MQRQATIQLVRFSKHDVIKLIYLRLAFCHLCDIFHSISDTPVCQKLDLWHLLQDLVFIIYFAEVANTFLIVLYYDHTACCNITPLTPQQQTPLQRSCRLLPSVWGSPPFPLASRDDSSSRRNQAGDRICIIRAAFNCTCYTDGRSQV